MEDDVGVEGYVLVEGPLLHLGDEVPGDGEQQQAVAEGEGGGRAPGHRYPDTHHVPQVPGIEFTFNFLSSLFNHSPAKKLQFSSLSLLALQSTPRGILQSALAGNMSKSFNSSLTNISKVPYHISLCLSHI